MNIKKILFAIYFLNTLGVASAQTQTWSLEGTLNNTVVISPDKGGNYIVGGSNSGHPDFDPGPAVFEIYSYPNLEGFIARYFSDGQFDWAFRIGTENGYGAVNDIFVDDSNHFYVTGCFRGTVDFNPGPDTTNLICTNGLTNDGYFAKYNTDGTLIFVNHIYGQGIEAPKKIIQLPNGKIIVAGSTNNVAHFNPISGFDVIIPNGGFDGFFACYSPTGDIEWVKSIGGNTNDYVNAIDNDIYGNIYLVGKFSDSIDVDPSISTYNLYAQSYLPDLFIMKCDSSGNFHWGRSLGSYDEDEITSIALNQFGEFYISGISTDTINLDPGNSNYSLPVNGINSFIARYKTNGDFLSGGQPQSTTQNVITNGMCIDDSSNVYITGRYVDTVDFDFGAGTFLIEPDYGTGVNIFFAKYTRLGDLLFAYSIGDNFFDIGNCISVDQDENIYLGGTFYGYVDFDIGPGTHFISATNSADAFFMKLKPTGYNHYLSTSEFDLNLKIKLFPNPTSDEITVVFLENEKVDIDIFDLQGRIIYSESEIYSSSKKIDTRNFNSGIYFIKVSGNTRTTTDKFIINRN